MVRFAKELQHFRSYPRNMQVLLATNMTYSLVLPIIELFVGAYIIRSSQDFTLVIVYQLAQGAGFPITFLVNAWLLRFVNIARLYSAGMVMSGLAMAFMMIQENLTVVGIALTGFLMGLSLGFFWANRVFLALNNTTHQNRNYYYGLESFFFTGSYIIMPFLAGVFIEGSRESQWFGTNPDAAYFVLTGLVILLTIAASYLVHRGRFRNPVSGRFLYVRFHRLWVKMMGLGVLRGVSQGFIITAPVMLIMRMVGDEGSVGVVQSVGSAISALVLYMLARMARPEHRIRIFGLGLGLFLLGATVNMALYSTLGVFIFVGCQVLARPLIDLAYFPLQLGVTECVASKEKRIPFTYIFNHEIGLFMGRMFGCGLFILAGRDISQDFALRYALAAIALVQAFSVLIARSIVHDEEWCEPDRKQLHLDSQDAAA